MSVIRQGQPGWREGLTLGTHDEVCNLHQRVFRHVAPDHVSTRALRASLLTAISPLRFDFEVHRLRGKAYDGEILCR